MYVDDCHKKVIKQHIPSITKTKFLIIKVIYNTGITHVYDIESEDAYIDIPVSSYDVNQDTEHTQTVITKLHISSNSMDTTMQIQKNRIRRDGNVIVDYMNPKKIQIAFIDRIKKLQ